jgi:hypothetical protein
MFKRFFAKVKAFLKDKGVILQIVVGLFGTLLIYFIPQTVGVYPAWPIAPIMMFLLIIIKEIMDACETEMSVWEYLCVDGIDDMLAYWIGLLVAIFVLYANASGG